MFLFHHKDLYKGNPQQSPKKINQQHRKMRDTALMSSSQLQRPLPSPRILLIDDHTLFRTGMRMIVQSFPGMGQVLEAASVMLARDHEGYSVDVILLDIHMPGINGLDGIGMLRSMFRKAKIIYVSASASGDAIADAVQRGADGFLPKSASADDIYAALDTVLSGGKCFPDLSGHSSGRPAGAGASPTLSTRQMQVLALLAQGKPNKVIARELSLSENTVRVHVSATFAHLGVNSRTAAVLAAQQAGLITVG
jgi:two-component system, NarL family, nitrate/nitrite response regulator NarL